LLLGRPAGRHFADLAWRIGLQHDDFLVVRLGLELGNQDIVLKLARR
jgi:hypothetical protein